MSNFVFEVDEKFNNYKIVDFLKEIGISLEIIKKVKIGGIFVNDVLNTNVNLPIKTKDKITILLTDDKANEYITPIKAPLSIIYEDDYFIAVNKPKGVLTHSSKHNKSISLEHIVCGYFYPKQFVFRAINRLDKDTSGIVLIAKDMLSASLVGEQIKRGEVKKTYLALVEGTPKEKSFVIEKPIKKQSENGTKRICSLDGDYAKTICSFVKNIKPNLSLIKVNLITGRTHQIRVHLSSIGLPLYADSLYGNSVLDKTYTLHATQLEFYHPFEKKNITLSCNLENYEI